MSDTEQQDIFAFLADPAVYPHRPQTVGRVHTHVAEIFLAGDFVYKAKRAVRYAFLDFTTLAAREAACRDEVRLNARTAPQLYLGTVAVRRAADGRLTLDALGHTGDGQAVEWLILMRRFDERQTFDLLAEHRGLRAEWIDELVDAVVALHDGAEIGGQSFGGREGLRRVIDENEQDMASLPALFPPGRLAPLHQAARRALDRCGAMLDSRRDSGFVRRCHGDLHLGNIVLWQDRPTPFDCIEFSAQLATIDVLYDLAFLLMDLEVRGLRPLANRAFSRYVSRQGGENALIALPLMLALRACVRAKVAGFTLEGKEDAPDSAARRRQIDRLLGAAEGFLTAAPLPGLIAVGGLSGSGKSTLAAALSPGLGRAPGALLLRTDVLRKRLAGIAPERRLPADAYTPEANRQVYGLMAEAAGGALAAGHTVVADAVFARAEERAAIAAVATRAGVAFHGLWLDAPAEAMKSRVAARRGDASDATPEIVARQLDYDLGIIDWTRLDAGRGADAVDAEAQRLLAVP